MIRKQLKESIVQENKYLFPLHIVDTDYQNFMITYSCHQEQRMPDKHRDDLSLYWDEYRAFEEKEKHRTPKQMAEYVKEQLWMDSKFEQFQAKLSHGEKD